MIVALVIVAALTFDFTNGFHDTANAMATTIATGALKPRVAVGVAAILNFVGAFISITVAATVAKGIVDAGIVTPTVIFAGLIGAIAWNLVTWWFGVPSSSSHALIGGMIGSAIAAIGTSAVNFEGVISKVIVPALIAPVLAGVVALGATAIVYRLIRNFARRARGARVPLGAGGVLLDGRARARDQRRPEDDGRDLPRADRQRQPVGDATSHVPTGSCSRARWRSRSAPTRAAGGSSRRSARRSPRCARRRASPSEEVAATVILASSHFGFPLSTTHVVSGAVTGSGVGRRARRSTGPSHAGSSPAGC